MRVRIEPGRAVSVAQIEKIRAAFVQVVIFKHPFLIDIRGERSGETIGLQLGLNAVNCPIIPNELINKVRREH